MAPKSVDIDISSLRYPRKLEEDPVFNFNGVQRPRWLVHLNVWLPRQDPSLETFIFSGALTTSAGKTIVSCLEQAVDLANGSAAVHTWKAPSPVTYVPADASGASYATGPADKRVPASAPHNFIVSRFHIEQFDRRVSALIVSTVSNAKKGTELKTKCNNSGREMLRQQHAAADDWLKDLVTPGSLLIKRIMSQVLRIGLSSVSMTAFMELREELEGWNSAQLTKLQLDDEQLVASYLELYRTELGTSAFSDLKLAMFQASCGTDLEKVCACIENQLNDMQLNSIGEGLNSNEGRLLKLSDGKKRPGDAKKYLTPQERHAAGEKPPKPCPHCGKSGHWGFLCRSRGDKPAQPAAAVPPADVSSSAGAVKLLASAAPCGEPSEVSIASAEPSEVSIASLFSGDAGDSRIVDLTPECGKALMLHGVRAPPPLAHPPPGDGATLTDAAFARSADVDSVITELQSRCAVPIITAAVDGTPSPMPYVHARTVVASLTPAMTVKDLKSALDSVGLPRSVVSPSTGGPSSRTKVHIVAEARASFSLPVLAASDDAAPMGLPVPAPAGLVAARPNHPTAASVA